MVIISSLVKSVCFGRATHTPLQCTLCHRGRYTCRCGCSNRFLSGHHGMPGTFPLHMSHKRVSSNDTGTSLETRKASATTAPPLPILLATASPHDVTTFLQPGGNPKLRLHLVSVSADRTRQKTSASHPAPAPSPGEGSPGLPLCPPLSQGPGLHPHLDPVNWGQQW